MFSIVFGRNTADLTDKKNTNFSTSQIEIHHALDEKNKENRWIPDKKNLKYFMTKLKVDHKLIMMRGFILNEDLIRSSWKFLNLFFTRKNFFSLGGCLNVFLCRKKLLSLFPWDARIGKFLCMEWIEKKRDVKKERLIDSIYKLLLSERKFNMKNVEKKLRKISCKCCHDNRERIFHQIRKFSQFFTIFSLSFSLSWTDCSELEKKVYFVTFIRTFVYVRKNFN